MRVLRFLRLPFFIALLGLTAWGIWSWWVPSKPELSRSRRELVDQLMPGILEDLHTARGGLRSVAVVHFTGDPTDYVTDKLRSELEQSGVLEVTPAPLLERVQRKLAWRVAGTSNPAAALAIAANAGAQGALYGEVRAIESFRGRTLIDVQIYLDRVAGGELVFDRVYRQEVLPPHALVPEVHEVESKSSGITAKLLCWLVIVLTLPLLSISFIRITVRKHSNRANFVTLLIYTTVAALLGIVLLGALPTSWASAAFLLLLCGFACAYNLFIMTFGLELEN